MSDFVQNGDGRHHLWPMPRSGPATQWFVKSDDGSTASIWISDDGADGARNEIARVMGPGKYEGRACPDGKHAWSFSVSKDDAVANGWRFGVRPSPDGRWSFVTADFESRPAYSSREHATRAAKSRLAGTVLYRFKKLPRNPGETILDLGDHEVGAEAGDAERLRKEFGARHGPGEYLGTHITENGHSGWSFTITHEGALKLGWKDPTGADLEDVVAAHTESVGKLGDALARRFLEIRGLSDRVEAIEAREDPAGRVFSDAFFGTLLAAAAVAALWFFLGLI